MKTLFTLFISCLSTIAMAQLNTISITAAGGLQSTVTKIYCSNPVLNENTQYAKTPVATLRIYKTGKKTNGLYLVIPQKPIYASFPLFA
jgi:hypothetical protein